jgi:hypothetical protein
VANYLHDHPAGGLGKYARPCLITQYMRWRKSAGKPASNFCRSALLAVERRRALSMRAETGGTSGGL